MLDHKICTSTHQHAQAAPSYCAAVRACGSSVWLPARHTGCTVLHKGVAGALLALLRLACKEALQRPHAINTANWHGHRCLATQLVCNPATLEARATPPRSMLDCYAADSESPPNKSRVVHHNPDKSASITTATTELVQSTASLRRLHCSRPKQKTSNTFHIISKLGVHVKPGHCIGLATLTASQQQQHPN